MSLVIIAFADEIVRQANTAISAEIVIGRYAEQRLIYQDKANFSDSKNRTVHMGIDLRSLLPLLLFLHHLMA